ncbi:hypothetical protein [Salinibacter altiplanensis]|uniref:hypothetical protein n=1 Tax=Salinibacter altiplanensis TaxID=1803181 RepID=UPI000C9F3274|nr:hypothetical protein [Salinibacter altiplanensis]
MADASEASAKTADAPEADAPEADARDDVVYSNVSYIAPATVSPDLLTARVLMVVGAAVVGGSSVYHATYTREGQSLDVSTMMAYVAGLTCAIAAQWTLWAWAVLPVAAVGYWMYPWRIDSYVHVPVWGAAALVMLAVQVGWWATPAAVLASAGGAIKVSQPGADSRLHAAWHVLGGLAGGAAMWVL